MESQNVTSSSIALGGAPPPLPMASGGSVSQAAAADILKNIDSAFTAACSSAVDAAREVEEARKNARAARDFARRFMSKHKTHVPELAGILDSEYDSESLEKKPTPHYPPRLTMPLSRGKPMNINGDSGWGKRRNFSVASQAGGQTSQSGNDDMVSLSLELDRAKNALDSEQMAHDETKSALAQAKLKNAQLEEQIERLLSQMETERETSGRMIDSLERDMAHSRMKLEAAEEDAEAALELARQNTDSRIEMEGLLSEALERIEIMKAESSRRPPPPPPPRPPRETHIHTPVRIDQNGYGEEGGRRSTSSKIVRFADSPTVLSKPTGETSTVAATPVLRPSRSMVSAGRQLLQRSMGTPHRASPHMSISSYGSIDSIIESASKRRQRLQDRLQSVNMDFVLPSTPISIPSPLNLSPPAGFSPSPGLLEAGINVVNLLRESGQRLRLSGGWWNGQRSRADVVQLETLARQYCTSVEVLMDRKQKELTELQSLCSLWEQGNSSSGLDIV